MHYAKISYIRRSQNGKPMKRGVEIKLYMALRNIWDRYQCLLTGCEKVCLNKISAANKARFILNSTRFILNYLNCNFNSFHV